MHQGRMVFEPGKAVVFRLPKSVDLYPKVQSPHYRRDSTVSNSQPLWRDVKAGSLRKAYWPSPGLPQLEFGT